MKFQFHLADQLLIGAREEQQDALLVLRGPSPDRFLCVLSDGVGGQSGGRLASQTVMDTARDLWVSGTNDGGPASLKRLVDEAHRRINVVAGDTGTRARATLVALYIQGQRADWVHVGDSRLYWFSKTELKRRTRDHSVVQLLADRGKISESEMGNHTDQGRLLQSLGGDDLGEPDYDFATIESDDLFLLCSDGFWENLAQDEILVIASAGIEERQRILTELSAQSVTRAGAKADNLSAILVSSAAVGMPPNRSRIARRIAIGAVMVMVMVSIVLTFALSDRYRQGAVEFFQRVMGIAASGDKSPGVGDEMSQTPAGPSTRGLGATGATGSQVPNVDLGDESSTLSIQDGKTQGAESVPPKKGGKDKQLEQIDVRKRAEAPPAVIPTNGANAGPSNQESEKVPGPVKDLPGGEPSPPKDKDEPPNELEKSPGTPAPPL